jgi:Sec-independent protein secretion pathway component TatC
VSPETTRAFSGPVPWRTTLGAVAHEHARTLVTVFWVASALATAAFLVSEINLQTLLPAAFGPVPVLPVENQVARNRLAVEAGLLVGFAATVLTAIPLLVRDDRVEVGRARRAFGLAVAGFFAGVVLGRVVVLPTLFELFPTALSKPEAATSAYWVTELGLFFPFVLGVAFAFAPLLVGAVRAGLLPRRTTVRHRTMAAIAFVVPGATHAPPDPNVFVLYAAPLFAALAVGVGWLEFVD